MPTDTDVKAPVIKAIIAWIAAIVTSAMEVFSTIPWDKLAQFAAFIYSCILIWDHLRKKFRKGDSNGTKQNLS